MLKLRLLNGPREGRQLRVSDTKPVSIGRNKGRLRLHDSRVSKRHAEICFEEGAWVIRDVGSSNGTYVNHERAEGEVALETGDLLQLGRVLVKVLRADEIGMDVLPGAGLDEAAGAGTEQAASADESDAGTLRDASDASAQTRVGHDEGGDEPGDLSEASGVGRMAVDEDADLVSLSDEGDGPVAGASSTKRAQPGTTAIAAITDDGEGAEASGPRGSEQDDDALDAQTDDQDQGLGQNLGMDPDDDLDDDDAFDEAPEVVGLSLNHRPPQQPTGGEAEDTASDNASAGDGGFDIDAAFDALAAGLEDAPEPGSPPEATPEATPEAPPEAAPEVSPETTPGQPPETSPELSDGLVDSQLDVGFIQDALAKLKDKASQSEADASTPPDTDEQEKDRG